MRIGKKTLHAASYMVTHFMNIFEQLKNDSDHIHISKEDKADSREFLVKYMLEGGDDHGIETAAYKRPFAGKFLSGLRSLKTIMSGRYGTIENTWEKKNSDH